MHVWGRRPRKSPPKVLRKEDGGMDHAKDHRTGVEPDGPQVDGTLGQPYRPFAPQAEADAAFWPPSRSESEATRSPRAWTPLH